jgi:peroxiredoxin
VFKEIDPVPVFKKASCRCIVEQKPAAVAAFPFLLPNPFESARMAGRWILGMAALAAVMLAASCAALPVYVKGASGRERAPDILKTVPVKYLDLVRLSLDEAGENAPELMTTLAMLRGREFDWACFLIGTMPLSDLISIRADYLLEHIRYTSLLYDRYPRVRQLPEDVFLAYVLPYRTSSEPIVAHRRYFFEQLDPLVKNCSDSFEASYQVNLWLGGQRKGAPARVRFAPGEARVKSPFGTLLAGRGRCEELTVALVAALRAVGIPARCAYTPAWVKTDNNHAWTEMWSDGTWYALSSGHPSLQSAQAATAGKEWFVEPAATAAAIYAGRFGAPGHTEPVYKASRKDSVINVLPDYSRICSLDIQVLGPDGSPAGDVPVALSVVNGGGFRKVALANTDAGGKAAITAGIGHYMLSAGNADLAAWQLIPTRPGPVPATLVLAKNSAPSGYYCLRFPATQDAYRAFKPAATDAPAITAIAEKYRLISPEHAPDAPPEAYCFDSFRMEEHPEIAALIRQSPMAGSIAAVLESAGGNWPELAAAIAGAPGEERQDLLWLISALSQVDAVEMTRDMLLEHVHYARLARKNIPAEISDDIYRSYVLSPVIPFLHAYPWRKELYTTFLPVVADGGKPNNLSAMALRLNAWIEKNVQLMEVSSGRNMTTANPAAVFTSRRAPYPGPILSTAAALRSVGIPARITSVGLEFYDGAAWSPLYPMDSVNLGNTGATEASRRAFAPKGGVRAITTKNGVAFSPGAPNWRLSRFDDGGWDQLRDESGNGWSSVPPGRYLFTAAARNGNGDVLLYARPLAVASHTGIEITVPLDLPLDMLSPAERVARKLEVLPDFTLADTEGRLYNFREMLSQNHLLLIFFTMESEPSVRMLPVIQSMLGRAAAAGVSVLGVAADTSESRDERLHALSFPVLQDKNMAVTKRFIQDSAARKAAILPSILLIRKDGEVLYWQDGCNPAIGDVLVDAFNTLSGKAAPADTLTARESLVTVKEVDAAGLTYAAQGLDYLHAGDYSRAVEQYRRAIDAFPDVSELWYNYGCALSRSNNLSEALAALQKAIELGSNNFTWMLQDPDLENVRKDARFTKMVRRQAR